MPRQQPMGGPIQTQQPYQYTWYPFQYPYTQYATPIYGNGVGAYTIPTTTFSPAAFASPVVAPAQLTNWARPPQDINGPPPAPQPINAPYLYPPGTYHVPPATPIQAPGILPLPIPPLPVPEGFTAGTPEDWTNTPSCLNNAKTLQFWASWPEDSAIPAEIRTYLSDCEKADKEPNWSYLYKRLDEAQAESTARGGRSSLPNPGIADPSTIVKIEYPYGVGGFPGSVGGNVPLTMATGNPLPHPGALSLIPAMAMLGQGVLGGMGDMYTLQQMATVPM